MHENASAGGVAAPVVDGGAVELLRLLRARPLSRAEIGQRTGWARATVNQRLEQLLGVELLVEAGQITPARGRPATQFRFHGGRALLAVADIGASGMRLAVCDLAGRVRGRADEPIDVADGPDVVLGAVDQGLGALLAGQTDPAPVWGVGVSVPGPVAFATGTVVSPPIMTGWDGVAIPPRLAGRFGATVFVDNDVNAMALGEHRAVYSSVDDVLFVKIGTGVGAGVIAGGRVLRGAQGTAGDIGHVLASPPGAGGGPGPLCRCGKTACVEAYAGGWAIVRDLAALGRDVHTVDDIVAAVRSGDPEATRLVRDSGRIVGAALADAVALLNPAVVVIGGQLSLAGDHLIAGIRELIYSRSLPLALRDLRIAVSQLGGDAGVIGLATGVADAVMTVEGLGHALAAPPTAGADAT